MENNKTKKGNQPEVRFEGFVGNWEEKKLGEVGNFKNGMNFGKEAMGHGYPFVNLQDVFGKSIVDDTNLGLAVSNEKQRKEYSLQKGDILFIRSSVKPEGVGETALVTKTLENTTYSGFIIRFRPEIEMDDNFNRFVYSTINIRKQIITSATSSANTNINQNSLQNIQQILPNITEQTKIGNYFKNLDNLITQHQRKHEQLANVKKAMLEKMFPKNGAAVPEIRFQGFEGKWEEKMLGEIANIVRGASPRPIQDPKWFDDKSIVGWLRISDVTTQNGRIHYLKHRISKIAEEKTRVLTEPHLLLSIAASVGKPVINYVKTGVHDGFLIFKNPIFYQEFMFQWMKMFEEQWQKYGQPGSQVNLNSEIVKNQAIFIPSIQEQTKIGNYFKQLDELITLHQTQLQKLKNIKKSMLEKMFV